MTGAPIGKNLFDAVLAGYDEIQSATLLVQGANLALDTAEEKVDRFAVQAILDAAAVKLSAVVRAMEAANGADADAYISAGRGK